jgi:hypothetical protein
MPLDYRATLTGASFLFFEFKQVLSLSAEGLTDSEIREKVLSENLFQYKVNDSLKRSLPSLFRRTHVLDDVLKMMVLQESVETGRMINLYAIMKTDPLFFDFMNEVIREKFEQNDYFLDKKDINLYFTSKIEQGTAIAEWKEQTVKKMKQVIMRILAEAGIIKNKKTGELQRIFMEDRLKKHLFNRGDRDSVKAMGEWMNE